MSVKKSTPGLLTSGGQDVPLFALPPEAGQGERESGRRPQTAGWGQCPHCPVESQPDRGIILVAAGQHLRWKWHNRPLRSGTPVSCRASGMAICELPPRGGVWKRRLSAAQRRAGMPETDTKCRCGK